MSEFTERVEANLKGIEHVSTGYALGCNCCPELDEDEGGFSWSSCASCGSTLGGNRYSAHGIVEGGRLIHLEVCEDCLCFLANGDEPE